MGVSSPRVFSLIWGAGSIGKDVLKRLDLNGGLRLSWSLPGEGTMFQVEREIHSGEAGGQSPDGENSKR